VKFCPHCGSELPVGTANFCSTCGNRLWEKESQLSNTFVKENEVGSPDHTIYAQGLKLEDMVEQIMKNKGFETSKREKIQGKSGALHKIGNFLLLGSFLHK
jgi:hypothetical protein